jgi:hypothetical protein
MRRRICASPQLANRRLGRSAIARRPFPRQRTRPAAAPIPSRYREARAGRRERARVVQTGEKSLCRFPPSKPREFLTIAQTAGIGAGGAQKRVRKGEIEVLYDTPRAHNDTRARTTTHTNINYQSNKEHGEGG